MNLTPIVIKHIFELTHLLKYGDSDIEVMVFEGGSRIHGGEGGGDLTHVLVGVAAVVQVVAETGHEEGETLKMVHEV